MEEKTTQASGRYQKTQETVHSFKEKMVASMGKLWGKRFVRIVAVLAVVIVLGLGVYKLWDFRHGCESVAKKAAIAWETNDFKQFEKYITFDVQKAMLDSFDCETEVDFFDEMTEYLDADIADWDDFYQILKEESGYEFEDAYGEYEVTASVKSRRNYSARKIWDLGYDETFDYNLEEDQVDKGSEVTVRVRIKGEDDTETVTYTACMVKTGLIWKVLKMGG